MSKAKQIPINDDDNDVRPHEEWEADVKHLANKVLKVVEGYVAEDAIAAMALVTKHILDQKHS
jgi:hypothetical protein